MSDAGWYRSAFEQAYLTVYAHRDDASAMREAAFVARCLGLRDGDRVLDAGCGAGRHARALQQTGARVVGTDLSGDLVATAAGHGGGPLYVRGDLRALPFRAHAFDHAVCLFTTFGYFDDAGDRAQLAGLRRVLRPGGGLLLDFLNAPAVVSGLVPASERVVGEHRILERRSIAAGRVRKDVEVVPVAGGPAVRRWSESVRLYGRYDLETMLGQAGFDVRAVHGDLAGGAWTEAAPRLVLHAVAA